MHREEKWKAAMSELAGDVKKPDLWRVSVLLDTRPKDVKEHMITRFDEIGENYENLTAKVLSYTTSETEQARGGHKEIQVPMEVDHVSCSEPAEEDREDVDEVRTGIDTL